MTVPEFNISPNCPYCGDYVRIQTSLEFYKKNFNTNVYYCQSCNASTTTHGDSLIPKGRLANQRLKRLRQVAHKLFDPLWIDKTHFKNRSEAHRWLKSFTCGHFAWMDIQEIIYAIEKIKELKDIQ